MRRSFTLFLVLTATALLKAGESKIEFLEATWTETIDKAKESQKMVFLDCYTDWCYWCKVMDKETFMDTSVTNLINTKFIPSRREMEKSDEGKALSMKYHVNGFPTYMIFDSKGVLVYEIVGYRPAADFKKELEAALAATTPWYPGMSSELDPGFPDFYKKSFGTGKERKKTDAKEAIEFLDKQKDLFSEISWSVMWRCPLNEKYENWIIENRKTLSEKYTAAEVEDRMVGIFMARNTAAAEKKDVAAFKANLAQMQKELPELAKQGYTLTMTQSFLKKTGDWKGYADITQSYADTCGARGDSFINGCAWTIYEESDDKYALGKAEKWMEAICGRTEEYAFEDTYAAVLYKNGNYKKAEEVALHAIDLGKSAEEDVSATESLLANIRLKIK